MADSQKKKKLLIVEDDPLSMKLLADLLEQAGYEVHRANYPLPALFSVGRVAPDLILADLNMPQVDGLTLIRLLKGYVETEHIPVVVVSASDTQEAREATFAAGCVGYVAKPVDTRRFLDQIQKHFKRPKITTISEGCS
jgi:CheY-like chemotaxis protein